MSTKKTMGNNVLNIDAETFTRLGLASWREATKDIYFFSKDIEERFKDFFMMGYGCAWHDMSKLSTGLHELDEIQQ